MAVIKENRVGLKSTDRDGEEVTIREYKGTHDVIVEWADGTTKKTTYNKFIHGMIGKETRVKTTSTGHRLGEKRVMNCGMYAKIIRYKSSNDMDVQFEDGYISRNRTYAEFVRGSILNPNVKTSKIGEKSVSTAGQTMIIIAYRNAEDVDIQFEDGTVVQHKYYKCFLRGTVTNPNYNVSQRIGMKKVMNNGQTATLIQYNGCVDVAVQFEDGTVVEHVSFKAFKEGFVRNPNYMTVKNRWRVGESHVQTCGMSCKIISYRGASDMDVEFEDGEKVCNVKYASFTKGYIRHPIYKGSKKALNIIGETRRMNNGQMATIIKAVSAGDITIRFEDGTVVENKKYCEYKEGAVGNPNFNSNLKVRTGEKRKMSCGLNATITAYRGWGDIDIEFEDGECKCNVSYGSFSRGTVAHTKLNVPGEIFFGFVTKKAFIDNGDTYYLCKCCHCGIEDIMTPYQMMEHQKNE